MEKRYSIDINYIQELKDIMVEYNADKIDIDRINNLLFRLSKNFDSNDEVNSLATLRDSASYYKDFNEYYKIVRQFISHGLYVNSVPTPSYKSLTLSDDDCLTLAHDFFKEQGKTFCDGFNNFYEDIDGHLEFIEPNIFTDGEIHFYRTTGDIFVFSPNHNNFTKASILIHELEHAIDCDINENFYENLLIREISAIFMEMIGVNYLADQLKLKDGHYMRRFTLHSIVKYDAYEIFYKTQLLSLVYKYKEYNDKIIRKILNNKYDMSNNFINYCNSYNLFEDYYYQISQLIAIELYTIYQNDKDKALYILLDIIKNGNDNNIIQLLKKHGISILRNYINYENEMCLKLGI